MFASRTAPEKKSLVTFRGTLLLGNIRAKFATDHSCVAQSHSGPCLLGRLGGAQHLQQGRRKAGTATSSSTRTGTTSRKARQL